MEIYNTEYEIESQKYETHSNHENVYFSKTGRSKCFELFDHFLRLSE
jgi:hypothetical protein